MNAGAKIATHDILYFLHADSYPPKNFDQLIESSINGNTIAGCFYMGFDSKHPVLRTSGWFTRFNNNWCRVVTNRYLLKRKRLIKLVDSMKSTPFLKTTKSFQEYDQLEILLLCNEIDYLRPKIRSAWGFPIAANSCMRAYGLSFGVLSTIAIEFL